MPTVSIKTPAGKAAGKVDLDAEIFGIEPNIAVMHQVVNAQLAARRAGTHSTKTRSEVRGGGSKPWRQKGTGRARAGSIRSPIWVGGGVAHGPRPRSYAERTNKKMINLALRSALSDRAADDKVVVVDSWGFDKPSTKAAKAALAALGVEGRALVVVNRNDENAEAVVRSFRNLPEVHLLAADQLNCYDILVADYIIFPADTIPGSETAAKPAADSGATKKPATESERRQPSAEGGASEAAEATHDNESES